MPALPPDFDWVTARHACSVAAFFERLYAGAQHNVETRKLLRLELHDHGPIEFSSTHGVFSVLRMLDVLKPPVVVRFKLEGPRIVVEGSGIDVQFSGTVTLNDAGECRLEVGGSQLDEWQVLKRALEKLFFGLESRR